jgi:DnaJ-class molecular chaperone
MNYKKALELLELTEGFTEDQLKKQFRKLAAKYHPDINKSSDAEKKSKEISEAYNFLKDPKNWNIPSNRSTNPAGYHTVKVNISRNKHKTVNIDDLFSAIKMNFFNVPSKTIKVSLRDAILGCNVKTSVDWIESCAECPKDNSKCQRCNGTKQVKRSGNWNLTLIPGIQHNTTITLDRIINNKNYKFSFVILVDEDPNCTRQGNDIFIKRQFSLLDVLRGGKFELDTFTKKIQFNLNPGTKNNDLVIVKDSGLPNHGHYKIIVLVDYPKDIDKLINFLEQSQGT